MLLATRPARLFAAPCIMLAIFAVHIFFAPAQIIHAQTPSARELRPDMRHALDARARFRSREEIPLSSLRRKEDSATLQHAASTFELRPRRLAAASPEADTTRKTPARAAVVSSVNTRFLETAPTAANAASTSLSRIRAGTPLYRVLHASQLSLISAAGTDEQYTDTTNDIVADERTAFDARGGSFDIAVGRSGARYEVYSALDSDPASTTYRQQVGVLVVGIDSNGDFVSDSSQTFNLARTFHLPSIAAVVNGTSKAGREFVVVSSSGYFNRNDAKDPDNEASAGVLLLVRDPLTGGFDGAQTRELVRVGSNQLNNANALALLPNNDLLIADFDSGNLRIVRDTNGDGIPDTLDPTPFYTYQYSDDAPLDIAANKRGVVFSHSYGNDAVLLALYDDNHDGRADAEEVVAEGLSLDNNLLLHGLTVDRDGTIYIIEDASGASDSIATGGNNGTPRISAFADPTMEGFLENGTIYAVADDAASQGLTGLAFGTDAQSAQTFNPIDDSRFFVLQQYLNFLDRAPDKAGQDYWTALIARCAATDNKCLNAQRVSVSAAFFIEQEFQQTGNYVYRLYKGTLNRQPTFAEFLSDRSKVIGGANLDASKTAFANDWIGRAEFQKLYPATSTPEQFIDALIATIRQTTSGAVDLTTNRASYQNILRQSGRGSVVRQIVEDQAFQQAEYNRAFVLMQYFGYLRRDPDADGYKFWLDVLNNRVANNYRGMVCAFVTSAEYQNRFGKFHMHTDAECGQ
ncbi:MAG: DUF4214 domain-containing protein [Pyrinomonadaceae bacterium]